MSRKILAAILLAVAVSVSFAGCAFADRTTRSVSSAEDFQKALDDGITDISITV